MNIARIEEKLIVLSDEVGLATYDFDFDLHFICDHPYRIDGEELCVLRIGPIPDYATRYENDLEMGLRLVNSPIEHVFASELEYWYPLLQDITPRTKVYESIPSSEEIERNFRWPIFMKGSRQTSKHNPALCIIQNRAHYEIASQKYRDDEILHWQKPVIREYIPLVPIAGYVPGKVKPSLEYRSFWWHGECVGYGQYWYQLPQYECSDVSIGLDLARQAALLLKVPFLVVDFAKTQDGNWIIIECNDAQESGYAGIPPRALWQQVLGKIDAQVSPAQATTISREKKEKSQPDDSL